MRVVKVEVGYANEQQQIVESFDVPVGSTTFEVIQASGILERFPEIDLTVNKVGIFANIVDLTTVVSAGDRVEIYRPLMADPKDVRRELAALGKAMGYKKV